MPRTKSATQRDQGVVGSSTFEEDCRFGEMSSHFLSRDYGNLLCFSDFLKRKVLRPRFSLSTSSFSLAT